jgi:hypothetical protein
MRYLLQHGFIFVSFANRVFYSVAADASPEEAQAAAEAFKRIITAYQVTPPPPDLAFPTSIMPLS